MSADRKPELRVIAGPGLRVPPQDLAAEGSVLSAIILDPRRLDDVRELVTPENFYSDANRRVFEAILELDREGQAIDIVTLASRLRDRDRLTQIGGTPYLYQLIDATPDVGHIGPQALIVRDKSRARRMIETCHRAAAEGYGDVGNVQEWLEKLESEMAELAHTGDPGALEQIAPILERTHAYLRAVAGKDPSVLGVATGFLDLDRKLAGLHGGDMLVLAGRPGMGKTSVALGIATGIASRTDPGARRAVAFFSLEMPKEQLGIRLIASEARVDLNKARDGRLDAEEWQRVTAAVAALAGFPIFVDDTPSLSIAEMRSRVRRLGADLRRSGQVLALVAIDYAQLVRPSVTEKIPREQQVAEISRATKRMAKELGLPVLLLAAMNRDVEKRGGDKRPQLSDLRESGALESDADVVLFVYRAEVYDKNTPDKGIAEIIVAKQRNGPTGRVCLRFAPEYTRFDNLALDEWADDFGDDP